MCVCVCVCVMYVCMQCTSVRIVCIYVTYVYNVRISAYTCACVYVDVCMLNVTPCGVVPAVGVTECCRDSPSPSDHIFCVRRGSEPVLIYTQLSASIQCKVGTFVSFQPINLRTVVKFLLFLASAVNITHQPLQSRERTLVLTFRRLMSTIVDVPHR